MKHKIAILGGSLRERIVAESLRANHFSVAAYAVDYADHIQSTSAVECLTGASALILPVRSNDENGRIGGTSELCPVTITEDLLGRLTPKAAIYCGIGSPYLRELSEKTGHPLKEIMEYDAVAVPNADLTAEGTVDYVMKRTVVSLADLRVTVFGFGRVGKACARLFSAVGSRVTVFCRSETDIRKGRELGFDTRYYSGASAVLPKTDLLINTVPAVVVTHREVSLLKRGSLIIDLASMPGGVDRAAAETCGIESVMLPGLPGKYAPVSAGRILASYYLEELKNFRGGDVQ